MSTSSAFLRNLAAGSALALTAALSSVANADLTYGVRITAIALDGSGLTATHEFNGAWNGDTYTWWSNQPVSFEAAGGVSLGTLNPRNQDGTMWQPEGSRAFYRADPQVDLSFAVQAGPVPTQFMIASGLLSFPTINGATAQASAGYSVTDFNGDGALLAGGGVGPANAPEGYLAQYNGFAGLNLGTTFADLIPNVDVDGVTDPFGTDTLAESHGFAPIGGPVDDMSSFVSFTLSPFDFASGTTNYVIVPEPASLGLLLVGVAALIRRR